ncbi:hypothetical protein TNCV_2838471 [Trichonephila clavipes]|nr:hypothetical protein TNCV_2838471 [Trichonephila clavipes]
MLTSSQGAPDFWTNRSCQITPFTMNLTSVSNHTASPVAQANMNGLSTYAMKVKPDQLLELPDTHNAQIIAIQETKLKEQMKLNIKEFHINRLH